MNYKNSVIYFLVISSFSITFLPLVNIIDHLAYNRGGDFVLDATRLYTTDKLESHVNYAAYTLFGYSLNKERVIIGKDGFLFLGNHHENVLDKTSGAYRPSDKDIDKWTDKLRSVQQWYEERDIVFAIAIAPNKHTIYREKLPDWIKPAQKMITDDIVEHSRSKKINIVDLRDELLAHKKNGDLYYKTDTHWNLKGASIGYRSIISYLNRSLRTSVDLPDFILLDGRKGGGDLAHMLKISSLLNKDLETHYSYKFGKTHDICRGNINKATGAIGPCKKTKNPIMRINGKPQYMLNKTISGNKLLWLGDSFSSAPSQLFNSSFNTLWKWHYGHISGEKLADFVLKNKPDIVLYQVVERSLYNEALVRPLSSK